MDKGEATIKIRATKSSEGGETKNGRGQAVGYQHIPQDVVVDVLAKLPAKSLMRFRCVSKTWSSLIRDPLFVHLHQNQSLNKPCKTAFLISSKHKSFSSYIVFADHEGKQAFDKDTISMPKSGHVLGISNGLACIVNDKYDISVYNLSTHETTTIPPPPQKIGFKDHLFFGFDPLAKEYKVVKFLSYEKEGFEIFTLGTKKWRKINREHYNFYGDTKWYDFKEPICVNGVIYWIVKFMAELIDITLHSFDLHGEKFQQVVIRGNGLSSLSSRLIQIGGCLAVVQAVVCGCGNKFYLQMLQDYHNKVWIHKIIGIPLSPNIVRYPTLAGTIGTGELLILDDHFSKYFRLFYNIMGSKRLRSAQIAMPPFIRENKWKAYYGSGYSQTGEKNWRSLHRASIFSFHHVENVLPLKEDN